MRILYLTSKPIFPLVDGGCVAMYQFLKILLGAKNEVDHFTISTPKHPFKNENYPTEVQSLITMNSVSLNTSLSIFGAIASLVKGTSYNISRFDSKVVQFAIKEQLTSNTYDLIICESLFTLPNLSTIRKHSKAKVILRSHNVEHKIWEDLANNNNGLKKVYLKSLAKALKKYELEQLNLVDGVMTITSDDLQSLKSLGINVPMCPIPVAIDQTDKIVSTLCNDFFHIGSMNWHPNIESVQLLIKELFPLIRKELPNAKLHLAGSFFPDSIQTDEENGIVVHGFVEDPFEFMNQSGIQLAPIQSGSGVRIKLLESMGHGIPTVTTAKGAEGIDFKNQNAILIAKDTADFVQKAIELAKNSELRHEIGENAHQLIVNNYSLKAVNDQFIEFIQTIS